VVRHKGFPGGSVLPDDKDLTEGSAIEEIPLRYECSDCSRDFELDSIHFPSCPSCESFNLTLLSGEEMDIANMELEI